MQHVYNFQESHCFNLSNKRWRSSETTPGRLRRRASLRYLLIVQDTLYPIHETTIHHRIHTEVNLKQSVLTTAPPVRRNAVNILVHQRPCSVIQTIEGRYWNIHLPRRLNGVRLNSMRPVCLGVCVCFLVLSLAGQCTSCTLPRELTMIMAHFTVHLWCLFRL